MPSQDPEADLANLLSPLDVEEFFATYWNRKFLHLPGAANRFAALFDWDVLNRALENHRFDSQRLLLVRGGQPIAQDKYLRHGNVHAAGLWNELSAGATLVFNQCDEVHAPLRDLCDSLERLFHCDVTTNLYAGWRHDHGFDTHWDAQDVLILQISGRKHWKVWNPTRLHPFRQDIVDTKQKPADLPLFDQALEPGDLLSIPRGFWHVAYPMDEPCLHLTITIPGLNGIGFLHWLADRMMSSETARMDLPVPGSSAQRRKWLDRMFSDIAAAKDDALIDQYLAHVDGDVIARPALDLPGQPLSGSAALTRSTRLALATSRPIHFQFEGESVTGRANGTSWKLDAATARALEDFNDFRPHTIAELSPLPDVRLQGAVAVMLMRGILRIVGPNS